MKLQDNAILKSREIFSFRGHAYVIKDDESSRPGTLSRADMLTTLKNELNARNLLIRGEFHKTSLQLDSLTPRKPHTNTTDPTYIDLVSHVSGSPLRCPWISTTWEEYVAFNFAGSGSCDSLRTNIVIDSQMLPNSLFYVSYDQQDSQLSLDPNTQVYIDLDESEASIFKAIPPCAILGYRLFEPHKKVRLHPDEYFTLNELYIDINHFNKVSAAYIQFLKNYQKIVSELRSAEDGVTGEKLIDEAIKLQLDFYELINQQAKSYGINIEYNIDNIRDALVNKWGFNKESTLFATAMKREQKKVLKPI